MPAILNKRLFTLHVVTLKMSRNTNKMGGKCKVLVHAVLTSNKAATPNPTRHTHTTQGSWNVSQGKIKDVMLFKQAFYCGLQMRGIHMTCRIRHICSRITAWLPNSTAISTCIKGTSVERESSKEVPEHKPIILMHEGTRRFTFVLTLALVLWDLTTS